LEGLNSDYQLAIDIHRFQVSTVDSSAGKSVAAAVAHVEFAAKIVGENGRIVGSRTFEAAVPAPEAKVPAAAAALDEAFAKASTDLVVWVAGVI
jgi:ABC-type uncharacterized transport system auxiliary subunit